MAAVFLFKYSENGCKKRAKKKVGESHYGFLLLSLRWAI